MANPHQVIRVSVLVVSTVPDFLQKKSQTKPLLQSLYLAEEHEEEKSNLTAVAIYFPSVTKREKWKWKNSAGLVWIFPSDFLSEFKAASYVQTNRHQNNFLAPLLRDELKNYQQRKYFRSCSDAWLRVFYRNRNFKVKSS